MLRAAQHGFAQHGFALHGYRLELPPQQLPYMVGPGLTTGPFTAETAARIRERIAHPVRAGALATALITGVGYGTLVSIPITALSDRADVLLAGIPPQRAAPGALAVPPTARPLLAAVRTFQVLRRCRAAPCAVSRRPRAARAATCGSPPIAAG
jgi:hypothetical protein